MNEENNMQRFIANEGEFKFKINDSTENVEERIKERNIQELASAMEKYMPIGSIVKINNSFKKYMIMGFNCKADNTVYDYLACEYPFGIDEKHKTLAFNHEQIEKVFHIGFVNSQEKNFKAMLKNGSNEIEDEIY